MSTYKNGSEDIVCYPDLGRHEHLSYFNAETAYERTKKIQS